MHFIRRALPLAALFALVLALLTGPVFAQGRLIIASGTDAVTLDAHRITDSPSATVSEHITETLFELTPDGRIVPHLVQSYEVSEDGLVWTMHLRHGIRFHDGTPFNAAAVRYNLERILDPANAVTFRFLISPVTSVDVVDEDTVRLTTAAPFAPILAHLTHSSIGMLSPAALERYGEDIARNPVGTYQRADRPKNPFTDARVRQAFDYAVDNAAINEFILGGMGRPSDAPIAPGIFGYAALGGYEYNPEKARQLLAEAGYPNGFRVRFYSPSGRYLKDLEVAEAVQAQLAGVGIQAEIVTLEWATYLDVTNRPADENEVPMFLLGWGTVTGDADYGLYPLFHSSQWVPTGSNRAFYSNPRVDGLLDMARTTPDEAVRRAAYREAMQIIMEDAPWLFLHAETQITAIRTNVEGVIVHPTERIIASHARIR